MKENNPYRENRGQIRELLINYENLKNGYKHSFIEEEEFDKIADYYLEMEDWKNAIEAIELGTHYFPYSATLLFKQADILLANRKYAEALLILEKAELFDASDINLYILKTDAYLALDEQEKAVALLTEALTIFEGEEKIELLFELADVYDDHENFDKIFDCLKMILEDEPNNEEALYKICFWTDFTGRNEEGIRLHQKIIDNYPYNELAWFNLAAAYQGLKLYEKAIDAYQYAVTIDDKFDYAWRNMGDAYIRMRKYKEAIEVLEKVNELAQPEDVILEAIGYCYDKLKKYAQARHYFKKASHIMPDDSKIIYKIACTYYSEQQWTSAFKQVEVALRMHRLQPDYNLLAGDCKVRMGQFNEAIQFYINVVSMRPKNKVGWESLIFCVHDAGFFDEALDQSNLAYHATGGKPIFLYYKSAALIGLGKMKEALLQLEEALQIAPKLLKKFMELIPDVLQNQQVVDVLARFKRNKSI
ncbi:MAG: hypothetical protein RL115_1 [Bacteroidota bacterium]|jgi:tetratricopeptide (TPR) repeat protein